MPRGTPLRWTGERFENVTPEEEERLGGIQRITRGDFDNDPDGWSRPELGAMPAGGTFKIAAGQQFRLVVTNAGVANAGKTTMSIELQRPGTPPETIARFETREGSVSRAEYQHAFHDPE